MEDVLTDAALVASILAAAATVGTLSQPHPSEYGTAVAGDNKLARRRCRVVPPLGQRFCGWHRDGRYRLPVDHPPKPEPPEPPEAKAPRIELRLLVELAREWDELSGETAEWVGACVFAEWVAMAVAQPTARVGR